MDLVAPSGSGNELGDVVTTDVMGSAGYNTGNYTTVFGGTSATCPQVAGAVCLMLSVNPNLIENDVRNILQETATDMGPVGFDNTFGYGRLDVCKAVSEAASRSISIISGADYFCSGSSTYQISDIINNNLTVSWSITPASGIASLTSNGNQATLTKVNDGSVTLTASIADVCGTPLAITKQIKIGAPTPSTLTGVVRTGGTAYSLQSCNRLITYLGSGLYSAYIDLSDPIATSYNWEFFSKSPSDAAVSMAYVPNGQHVEVEIKPQGANATYRLTVSNGCGVYTSYHNFRANVECLPVTMADETTNEELLIAPNPAKNYITITIGNPTTKSFKSISAENRHTASKQRLIYGVRIIDRIGVERKRFEYKSGTTSVNISLTGLDAGLYFVSIFDGQKWQTNQVVVEK